MQGSKKWEFEFDKASTATGGIVDIAWSPDGNYISDSYVHDLTVVFRHFHCCCAPSGNHYAAFGSGRSSAPYHVSQSESRTTREAKN